MARDLVADANDNYERAFASLAATVPGGETSEFGPLTAVATGVPSPLYNRVFVFEPPSRDEFVTAVEWLSARDVPFWVTITADVLADVAALARDAGLGRSGASDPGMVLPSLDDVPPNESGVEIVEVTTDGELDAFVGVATAVFGMPRDVNETVYRAALEGEESHLFLGRVDDEAAACGLLIRSGDVAGVYTIGVTEPFRRRGLGEAMTWAVLRAGHANGCRVGVLQSSDMAIPLYERMGFETVVTYHHVEPDT